MKIWHIKQADRASPNARVMSKAARWAVASVFLLGSAVLFYASVVSPTLLYFWRLSPRFFPQLRSR